MSSRNTATSNRNQNDDLNMDFYQDDRIQTRQRSSQRRYQQQQMNLQAGEEYDLQAGHAPHFYSAKRADSEPLLRDDEDQDVLEGQGLRRDLSSILLLLLLYLLQGIPLGLSASIPMILQNRQVSYHQQALFSFAYWPFSLKLLWAPIVDSVYWSRIGRRKSWLVPVQYLIGLFMLFFSDHVNSIIGDDTDDGNTASPNVVLVTSLFFALNFLAATQDIAVDGWALSMLSRHNVGYASTCNAVGQTAGYFLGNAIFLSLESPEFCNTYLRSEPKPYGVVTLADCAEYRADFVYFWALVFMITTTLVLLFKREVDHRATDGDIGDIDNLDIVSSYKMLWKIIRLKAVLTVVALMLTAKMAFAAGDGITGLKLIELGVPKDKLALLAIPLTPLQIILPWILGRYTAGPRPMNVFQKAYPFKTLSCVILAIVVYYTPMWQLSDGQFPPSYYVLCIAVYCFHSICAYAIYVATMAFNAQISDPSVGGTYMTLLNTITNMGGNWPVTVALWVTDDLTWKSCSFPVGSANPNATQWHDTACHTDALKSNCEQIGGSCVVTLDGYYILIGVCFVIGLIWWRYTRKIIYDVQSLDKSAWACTEPRNRRR